jgi:hypothetical protein
MKHRRYPAEQKRQLKFGTFLYGEILAIQKGGGRGMMLFCDAS